MPLTLQLTASEILQDLFPVRRIIIPPQIRLLLARQNLQRRTLADTVRPNQSEHLSRPWHGQAVQLEGVGGVSVGDLSLEVGGQIDDVDGVEGADTEA